MLPLDTIIKREMQIRPHDPFTKFLRLCQYRGWKLDRVKSVKAANYKWRVVLKVKEESFEYTFEKQRFSEDYVLMGLVYASIYDQTPDDFFRYVI